MGSTADDILARLVGAAIPKDVLHADGATTSGHPGGGCPLRLENGSRCKLNDGGAGRAHAGPCE